MTYTETLDYLYKKLPMYSRMGSSAFKKDLTNIVALCQFLGNPQSKFKSIHVAGTNGKGSVSHMLAAVLQKGGFKTGLYTSPHLQDFRERIRVNGEMTSEGFVIDFVQRIKQLIEQVQPSFFEITVAMAFEYFAQQQVDIAIVEVGLGGRLDSTNIIHPELSVITNIGFDHMDMLGDTLSKIAAEKGGIIKEGIPVVIGEKHPETEPVFTSIATEKKAPIYFAQEAYSVQHYEWKNNLLSVSVKDQEKNKMAEYQLDLPGIYQTNNIVTVLKALHLLESKGYKVAQDAVTEGLKQTRKITGLQGRWEVLRTQPSVVLEVAHNEEGIKQLLMHLDQIRFDRLHIVFGMVKDKEIESVLMLMPKQATYYFTNAHIPRAMPAGVLQDRAAAFHLYGKQYDDVNTALDECLKNASSNDLILVCGSIFLVAEVNKSAFIPE